MREIIVRVTQQDLNDGAQCDCRRCPVALALRRRIRPEFVVEVHANGIVIGNKDIKTPLYVAYFTGTYDHARYVPKPFTFEVDVPERMLRASH